MAKTDYAELERAREERHEARWRIAGTFILRLRSEMLIQSFCRNRSCSRNRICCGPMQATPRQGRAIARERELGLSGAAVACLPVCTLNAEKEVFDNIVAATLPQIDALRSGDDAAVVEYYLRKPNRRQRRLFRRLGQRRHGPLTLPPDRTT